VVYHVARDVSCCRGALDKRGEDVTETPELIPRQCKVIR
jgi:transposase